MGSILSPVIDDDDNLDEVDNDDDHTGGRGDSGWTVVLELFCGYIGG